MDDRVGDRVGDIVAVMYSEQRPGGGGGSRVVMRFGCTHWPLNKFRSTINEAREAAEAEAAKTAGGKGR